MRYVQGGGLGPRRQGARERIRMLAGEGVCTGREEALIARELRVSLRSVERWLRAWRAQGLDALRSSGPSKRPKVSTEEFALLEVELLKGTVLHGWPDERWTLSRVELLIEDRLERTLSVRGVWGLLRRHG
ncbi:winged helix-turn-helix domain-containing protein [Streptomyces sp. NPDC054864]